MTSRSPLLRRTLGIGLLVLACIATWYAGVVYSARNYTRDTLLPKVRAAQFPVALADLTARQKDILLQVEDPGFYRHRGIDLATPGAGLTTITQAVVGLLYFEKFEPGLDKLRQSLIAVLALDPLMSKDEQLLLFLNTAYFGHGAYGFDAASRTYFRKPFRQLAEDEYIALVAALIAPEVFDVQIEPERVAERVARIKRLVGGTYRPRGVFDLYYGAIDPQVRKLLPRLSYFGWYYDE